MLPDKVPGSLEEFRELGSSLLAGAAGDNLSSRCAHHQRLMTQCGSLLAM